MHVNVFFLLLYKPVTIKIKDSTIESYKSEKLLGVTIDCNLPFDNHLIDNLLISRITVVRQGKGFMHYLG